MTILQNLVPNTSWKTRLSNLIPNTFWKHKYSLHADTQIKASFEVAIELWVDLIPLPTQNCDCKHSCCTSTYPMLKFW